VATGTGESVMLAWSPILLALAGLLIGGGPVSKLRWLQTRARRWTHEAARAGPAIELVPRDDPVAVLITSPCPRCEHDTRDRNPIRVLAGPSLADAPEDQELHRNATAGQPLVDETFAVDCHCGMEHPGRKAGDGCGARWYLAISGGPPWEVGPGEAMDAPTEEDEAVASALVSTELERARKSADSWKTALAGLVTLVATFAILKGEDSIAKLAEPWPIVGALVAAGALGAAVAAALFAARGAYGDPGEEIEVFRRGAATRVLDWQASEARRATSDIGTARGWTLVAVTALAVTIGITWFAPQRPPAFVRVVPASGDPVCGKLKSLGQNGIVITDDDGRDQTTQLSEVRSASVLADCP
jgi:hypothetical protein